MKNLTRTILLGLVTAALLLSFVPLPAEATIVDNQYTPSRAKYAPGDEIIELRQENSKAFQMENGQRQLVISMGAVHYKDNYTDKSEQWKDIDLTWEGNKITKAPYELTRAGSKITIRDKKTGEVSTIERLDVKPAGLPFEIVPENTRVSFRHTLPSDKVPFEARFKVTGKGYLVTRAFDDESEIGLETSLVDGILTEKLSSVKDKQTGQIRPAKGNIRVDPTWQVGASSDDAYRRLSSDLWSLVQGYVSIGAHSSWSAAGIGMRFLNLTIPQGTTIDGAYLTLRCPASGATNTVNSRISAEDVDDAPTFADNKAAFDSRWAARTAARVAWDGIGAWTANNNYNSPEIKTVIQEIVDRGGWASGQDMVIFWDDFDDRSTHATGAYRIALSYDGSAANAPKLVVTYTELAAPTVTTQAATDVEATSCTGNGNITDTGGENSDYRGIAWDTTSRGDPGALSPAASDYANYDSEGSGDYGVGVFDTNITGLTPGSTNYARAYAHNSVDWNWGSEVTLYTKPNDPTNLVATAVSDTQIDLTWTKGTGAEKTYIRGKDGSYPADRADGYLVYDDTGASVSDSGLTGGHTYYYRAWAWETNSGYSDGYDEAYSLTFSAPALTTNAASLVEETSATLNAQITAINGANAITRGFEWDTDSGAPYTNDWYEDGSYGVAAFSHALSGLTKGELYYYRAYATNTYGTGYGDEVTFLAKPDLPNTFVATAVSGTQIDFTWAKGTGAQKSYIRGKDGSYPVDRTDGYEVYNNTGTAASDAGLTGGHTYYYKIWSYATEGGLEQYSDFYDSAYASPGLSLELWFQPIIIITNTSYGGTADAGSDDNTIIDAELTQAEGYWINSLVTITGTTDGLAPKGETSICTAFTAATDEVTVTPAFSAVVGTGDTYTIEFGTLVDRTGGNDGTITWGVLPTGVEIALGGMVSDYTGTGVDPAGAQDIAPVLTPPPASPADAARLIALADNPLTPIFHIFSEATGIYELWFWWVGSIIVGLMLFGLTYKWLRNMILSGSLFCAVIAFFIALGVYDLWVVMILIVILFGCVMMQSRRTA